MKEVLLIMFCSCMATLNGQISIDTVFNPKGEDVEMTSYYRVDSIKESGAGNSTYFTDQNVLYKKKSYSKNSKRGTCIEYHENGFVKGKGTYVKNKKVGEWCYNDFAGDWVRNAFYKKRKGIVAEYYKTESNKKIYSIPQKEAHFGSCKSENKGMKEMGRFLNEELVRPAGLDDYNQVFVSVSFLIAPSGKLEELEVLTDPMPLFDNAVLDVIRKMPLWTPAYYKGKAVYSSFEIGVSI